MKAFALSISKATLWSKAKAIQSAIKVVLRIRRHWLTGRRFEQKQYAPLAESQQYRPRRNLQQKATLGNVDKHNPHLVLAALLSLDIDSNPDMNIDDVILIQDSLLRNKQDYDDERYMEFIERKRMRRE
jgi:hypothetical protein